MNQSRPNDRDPMLAMGEDVAACVRQAGGGKYEIRRGPVNWTSWPFEKHPRGASIVVADAAMFFPPESPGREATLHIDLCMALRDWSDPNPAQADDGAVNELFNHARMALQLLSKRQRAGESALFSVNLASARFQELTDDQFTIVVARTTVQVTF